MCEGPTFLSLTATEWKDLTEAFAWVAASLFFGYKAAAGYLVINLSVSARARRQSARNRHKDDLVIMVRLAKGDRGSLVLEDAAVRVRPGPQEPIPLQGQGRLSHKTETSGPRRRRHILWTPSRSAPFLRLTPG